MVSRPQLPTPDASDVALVQQVQQFWTSGNQAPALDLLRTRAEANEPWAAALLAWLLMQQGPPGLDESVTWALKAAQLGLPGQSANTFNNALANLPNIPGLAARLPELLQSAVPWMGGIDLMSSGWTAIAQGAPELGLQIMSSPGLGPFPQLDSLLEHARSRSDQINHVAETTQDAQTAFDQSLTAALESIEKARSDVETSANQAKLLVTSTTSTATAKLFDQDAERNAKESLGVWRGGLAVLALAAAAAVAPLVLHYIGLGPTYSAFELVGVHLTSTVALASFAGVLLARARSRDRAAQRARDLSTAMGTMIVYSNQISDPSEKQRFMTFMGQAVLQAHLTSNPSQKSTDDSASNMMAIANLVKSMPSSSPNQS